MQMQKCSYGTQGSHTRDMQNRCRPEPQKKLLKYNREAVIKKQLLQITDLYSIGQKIGSGSFGEVYKITHKELNTTRALKIFNKNIRNPISNPYEEVDILKQLDHPNVLKIYQYFQTDTSYEVVTEYFQGKELFDVIIDDKGISERKAATIFAEICKALAYVHAHDIVHRDIKPENILVKKQDEDQYTIKLIDWGLGSRAVKELVRRCGTPEYCAPEVIKGSYGRQCDLWSLGTVLYVMLMGKYPFKGENRNQTLSLIARAQFSFKDPEWSKISTQAKLLISKLMRKDPKNRIKASQCLNDPWILNNLKKQGQVDIKLTQTLDRLKQINFQNKFQAVAINFIHNYIQTSQQTLILRKQFEYLDQDKDGVLSYEQLKKGYTHVYGQIQAQRIVQNIFNQIDIDCSNKIQYSQFVAFGTKITEQFSKQQLKEAFRSFDQNEDGKINKSELNSLLSHQRGTQSQDFEDIMNHFDKDKDGCIDIDEFVESINKVVEGKLASENTNERTPVKGKYLYSDMAENLFETFKVNKLKKFSFSTLSNITEKQEKQYRNQI